MSSVDSFLKLIASKTIEFIVPHEQDPTIEPIKLFIQNNNRGSAGIKNHKVIIKYETLSFVEGTVPIST